MKNSILIKKSKLNNSNININGYKHAAVSLIALATAYNNDYEFENIPDIEDTYMLINILKSIGKNVTYKNKKLRIYKSKINSFIIPNKFSEKIHGSIYLIPAILGVKKRVVICKSGGCQIGNFKTDSSRPVHHMIDVMSKFGAKFNKLDNGDILGNLKEYKHTSIDIMDYSDEKDKLTGPCVSGATKTALLCSLNVNYGITYIHNPYLKPDVTELLTVMKKLGFEVLIKDNCIIIKPPLKKRRSVIKHDVISDITEIITYISLAVYCKIQLTLNNISTNRVFKGLKSELIYLEEMGIKLKFYNDKIIIPVVNNVKSINIDVFSTGIYSDSQPFFALMLLRADNKSIIREHVWKNRFKYALQMNKLGLNLTISENELLIIPGLPVLGGTLVATDLRAAAVLIIFALMCEEEVKIIGISHLKRGYSNLFDNLRKIGVIFQLCDKDEEEDLMNG